MRSTVDLAGVILCTETFSSARMRDKNPQSSGL